MSRTSEDSHTVGGVSIFPPRFYRPLQSNVSGVSVGNAGKPGSSPELHASPKVKLMATSLRKLDKSPIPTGASEWKKSALDVLNVHYERRDVFDFDFDDLTIPSNVQEDIDTIATEFERVNKSSSITPDFEFDVDDHPILVHFVSFYQQLSLILSKKPATSSSETPSIRTTLPLSDFHPSSPRSANTVNPRYSSSSTATTSSRESKHEHFTHTCANDFVSGSFQSLKKTLEKLAWYRSADYRLRHSSKQTMYITLNNVRVTAESDGGLSLQPRPSFTCLYPVFSIETKRKKHRTRDNESVYQMHAAQIYAEMLGQVCHKNLYNSTPNGYQESFVLHARHATFYLFYAKFSNTYLRDIAKYGSEYLFHIPNPERIIIKQSRPFRMRLPQHQAAFFRLITKVLCYLVSGNSCVGYLAKDEHNPYYRSQVGLDKHVTYECIRIKESREQDSVLEAEGPLDDESDCSDVDVRNLMFRTDSPGSKSITSSMGTESGSPMNIDDL